MAFLPLQKGKGEGGSIVNLSETEERVRNEIIEFIKSNPDKIQQPVPQPATSDQPISQPSSRSLSLFQRIYNYFYPSLEISQQKSTFKAIQLVTKDRVAYLVAYPVIKESPYFVRLIQPILGGEQKQISIEQANNSVIQQIASLINKQQFFSSATNNQHIIIQNLKDFIKQNPPFFTNIFALLQQAADWQLTTISEACSDIIAEFLLQGKRINEFKSLPNYAQITAMTYIPWTIENYDKLKSFLLPLIKNQPAFSADLDPFLDTFINFLLAIPGGQKKYNFIQSLDVYFTEKLMNYIKRNRLPFVVSRLLPAASSLAFNNCGQLIQGTNDGKIIITDLTSRNKIQEIQVSNNPIELLIYRSDTSFIILTNNNLIDFNPISGINDKILLEHTNILESSIFLSQDGNYIVLAKQDGTLIINAITKQSNIIRRGNVAGEVIKNFYSTVFDSLRNNIIVGSDNGTIDVWQLNTRQHLSFQDGYNPIAHLAIHNDILISSSSNSNRVTLWNLKTFENLGIIELGREFGTIKILKSIVWNQTPYIICGSSNTIAVISLQTRKVIEKIKQSNTEIMEIALNPRRTEFATALSDRTDIWQLVQSQKIGLEPITLWQLLVILEKHKPD